ncbi:serine/threonine protein phosphatase [Fulvivirga imtechensis AK7]|uniref:Serine/threonine protein phosphatase n=1 Tax=Fulvivirga imtechensis AK7 TaxID=1237149 RepID=L8JL41_9BACT|nr:metallophosphoesterase [Fulvivirga imtechensis]ELR69525.1 serine/threonine protein phosphatase [Fulvivirga imtechensis AK7]
MRQFVIGDIHGACKALIQCLERSGFDYEHDQLICLGDVCDGWPETNQAIEELLKIQNLVFILGNHDLWALEWATGGEAKNIWLSQGGDATIRSYPDGMPDSHIRLLKEAHYYFDDRKRLFVHAGIDPEVPIEIQSADIFLWDRSLFRRAIANMHEKRECCITGYNEVYIGHTPIHHYQMTPMKCCEIWLMDTGAGWEGVLSMMDINTKEVFISDIVMDMYPKGSGRVK